MRQGGSAISSGYIWDAAANVSGVKYFTVTSDTKSLSPSGTVFNVTFTPDEGTNTMESAANIVFVQWETETESPWPENTRRRTLGVCEKAYVTLSPYSQSLVLEKYLLDSVLTGNGVGTWTYTAPAYGATDIISAQGAGTLFSFETVAPHGYDARLRSVSRNAPQGVAGGFAMHFELIVLPTNVSFHAIKIKEVGALATDVSGYFADVSNSHLLCHSQLEGAEVWTEVYLGNRCYDMARIPELDPPWWNGGAIIYPIPNEYKGSSDSISQSGYYFCNTDQRFELYQTGKALEEKFGWYVTVTTNRVFEFGRTTE